MTEADWNRCDNPSAMVQFLRVSGRATERQFRLYACACVRRLNRPNEEERHAVKISERFADGQASPEELLAARAQLTVEGVYSSDWSARDATYATVASMASATLKASSHATGYYCCQVLERHDADPGTPWEVLAPQVAAASQAEQREQATILKDLFGNPFAPPLPRHTWPYGLIVRKGRSTQPVSASSRTPSKSPATPTQNSLSTSAAR